MMATRRCSAFYVINLVAVFGVVGLTDSIFPICEVGRVWAAECSAHMN